MTDIVETATLFKDARHFLNELKENNNRDWFQGNKSRYDSELKRPAERLMSELSDWFEAQLDQRPKSKLFRPHRDVRFSKDKTPYHTHLHLLWSLPDGRCWMLGISPDYATAGAGVMGFEKEQLDRFRAAVDADTENALPVLLEAGGWRIDPPELKRVPAPFPADHARGALLRRKGLVAWRDDLDEALKENPLHALQTAFAELQPLHSWLDRALN